MKHLLSQIATCCLLFSYLIAYPQGDSLFLNSKVSDVNVFFAGAQVDRFVEEVQIPKGKSILIFDDLPIEVQPNTVNAKTLEGATIHSVVYEKFRDYRKSKEEKDLDKGIVEEKKKLRKLRARLTNLNREEDLILNNDKIGTKNGTSINQIEQAANFYRTRLQEISNLKIQVAAEYDSIILIVQDLARQVNKFTSQRYYPKGRIIMVVESKEPIKREISVSYFVPSARWEPIYDFKVTDLNSPLKIVNRAKIYQSTGENWEKVNLTLSTGTPQQKVQKPTLQMWDILYPPHYPDPQGYEENPSSFTLTLLDDEMDPLKDAIVTVKKEGNLVYYKLTDGNGQIHLNPIPSGRYEIEVESFGFVRKKQFIQCSPGKHKDISLYLKNQYSEIQEVEVVWSKPLIEKGRTTEIRTQEEIRNLPVRNLSQIAATTAGVFSSSDGLYEVQTMEIESFNLDMEVEALTNRISFELNDLYDVPSNGKNNYVEMFTQSVPVDYIHYVVPKIEPDVYLTASIPDVSKLGLSKGEVNVYFEGVYTGQSYLDPLTISDTLVLSLGADKNVFAQRKLVTQKTTTSSFGSSKRVNIGYEYELRNNRKEEISVVVQDQIPISPYSKITVELIEKSGAQIDEPTGFLDWEFSLAPSSSKQLKSEFQIRMPSSTNITFD